MGKGYFSPSRWMQGGRGTFIAAQTQWYKEEESRGAVVFKPTLFVLLQQHERRQTNLRRNRDIRQMIYL